MFCILLLLGGGFIVNLISCDSGSAENDISEIYNIRDIIQNEKFIMHAGGFVADSKGKNISYTNSRDSVENCLKAGRRICELDFRISTDNFLVCTHEWNQVYSNGIPLDSPVSKDEFLSCKIYGEFASMDLESLKLFFAAYEDFYVVTDSKDNNVEACRIIARDAPEFIDRFIIQIYHASEYDKIRELGFKNIIYTLYRTSQEEREISLLIDFAKSHPFVGFTYWYYFAETYLETFSRNNIPSYIHTVNDKNEQVKFFNLGAAAIYTDSL
ncbi:MAG TPA: hypothetical protein DCW73_00960 [Treponema sp.]|nr:hypothetical protein [Treponema sp.]